ncbi:MAG: hypothetical protein Q4F53_09870 [Nesterenkonia sp.]|nr:hypothetical protein [Nesterenkonia sp.]
MPELRRGGAAAGAVLLAPGVLSGCVALDDPVYGEAGPPRWGPEDVPDLGTMLDEAEEAMSDRETFRADVVVEGGGDLQEWQDPLLDDAASVEFAVAGAVDASASDWRVSVDDDEVVEARVVDGSNYMSPSTVLTLVESALEEDPLTDPSDVDLGQIEDELDGRWVQDVFVRSTFDGFSLEGLVEGVHEELDGEDPSEIPGELRMTAGGYVYDYSGTGYDISFAAQGEPLLSRADYDEVRLELSGWDAQEVPEAPSEVVSEWELEEILMRGAGDSFGDGFGDGGGDPWGDEESVPAGR